MDLKLLTVTFAAIFVAFRVEECQAQFFPNLFNNGGGGNNQAPGLFPVLGGNNQNERPGPNWPYISNPSQQQQIQQGLNDQVGQGQPSKNPQSWQQQPYGGSNKENNNNNNYFSNNPFFGNFGFPSWFGGNSNKQRPTYTNPNQQQQPSGYQQQPSATPEYSGAQPQPIATPEYNGGGQPSYQNANPNPQSGYQQQQQQPVENSEYSGGKQQPGILPSSYQNQNSQPGYQNQNQPGYQNQQGYQNGNQPGGYQGQNSGYQNPQYVPQTGSQPGGSQLQSQPIRPSPNQQFDDGQYRPDKYGSGGGFQPSYNRPGNRPSGNLYAPSQQQNQPQERDLVGDLRINGSGNGSPLDLGLEQGQEAGPLPTNNETGEQAQPLNWVYPDD